MIIFKYMFYTCVINSVLSLAFYCIIVILTLCINVSIIILLKRGYGNKYKNVHMNYEDNIYECFFQWVIHNVHN